MMYLQSLTMNQYGAKSVPSGTMYFAEDDGTSLTIRLKDEDARHLQQLAFEILEREKSSIADKISKIETPPLLDYQPGSPMIDSEIPF